MYFLKGFPDILFVYCHSFLAHLNEVGGTLSDTLGVGVGVSIGVPG